MSFIERESYKDGTSDYTCHNVINGISFTPDSSYDLTRVGIKAYHQWSGLRVSDASIYSTSSSLPLTLLTTTTSSSQYAGTDSSGAWVYFDFTPYTLTADTEYALVAYFSLLTDGYSYWYKTIWKYNSTAQPGYGTMSVKNNYWPYEWSAVSPNGTPDYILYFTPTDYTRTLDSVSMKQAPLLRKYFNKQINKPVELDVSSDLHRLFNLRTKNLINTNLSGVLRGFAGIKKSLTSRILSTPLLRKIIYLRKKSTARILLYKSIGRAIRLRKIISANSIMRGSLRRLLNIRRRITSSMLLNSLIKRSSSKKISILFKLAAAKRGTLKISRRLNKNFILNSKQPSLRLKYLRSLKPRIMLESIKDFLMAKTLSSKLIGACGNLGRRIKVRRILYVASKFRILLQNNHERIGEFASVAVMNNYITKLSNFGTKLSSIFNLDLLLKQRSYIEIVKTLFKTLISVNKRINSMVSLIVENVLNIILKLVNFGSRFIITFVVSSRLKQHSYIEIVRSLINNLMIFNKRITISKLFSLTNVLNILVQKSRGLSRSASLLFKLIVVQGDLAKYVEILVSRIIAISSINRLFKHYGIKKIKIKGLRYERNRQ